MSRPVHRYRAHGLTIESEIELPDLMQGGGEPDVTVRYGEVPADLGGDVFHGQDYQVAGDHYLLTIPRVGRYLVTSGRTVIVSPAATAPAVEVRMYIMSSVMGAIAHQRQWFALHASGVMIGGRCALFAGEHGMGKSTLAAAFHARGCEVVSDDLSVISIDPQGRPLVAPGYRRLKLLPDALEHVGASLGAREWTEAQTSKYSVKVPGEIPLAPIPVARVFVLTHRLAERVSVEPLRGRHKVSTLVRETYRRGIPVALGHRKAHFEQCVAMSRHLDIAAISRPDGLQHLPEVMDRIQEDLAAL